MHHPGGLPVLQARCHCLVSRALLLWHALFENPKILVANVCTNSMFNMFCEPAHSIRSGRQQMRCAACDVQAKVRSVASFNTRRTME